MMAQRGEVEAAPAPVVQKKPAKKNRWGK